MNDTKLKKGIFFVVCVISFSYLINFLISAFSENVGFADYLKLEGFHIIFWLSSFLLSLGYTINYFKKKKK